MGYIKAEDEYSINYSLKNLFISINFPPNSEESDILIRFWDANQAFSIGWIALVRNNMEGKSGRIENIVELIKYIRENYESITDYEYCLKVNVKPFAYAKNLF